jgi:hypothetical protein
LAVCNSGDHIVTQAFTRELINRWICGLGQRERTTKVPATAAQQAGWDLPIERGYGGCCAVSLSTYLSDQGAKWHAHAVDRPSSASALMPPACMLVPVCSDRDQRASSSWGNELAGGAVSADSANGCMVALRHVSNDRA